MSSQRSNNPVTLPFRWLYDRFGIYKTLGLLVLIVWVVLRGSAVFAPGGNMADKDGQNESGSSFIARSGNTIILYTVNFFDEIRTNFTGQNIPICQPRHYNVKTYKTVPPGPKVEKRFKLLTDKIVFQVDRAQGGNIATSVKNVLDEWKYPVIVLPYMTETTAQYKNVTDDVIIIRMPHLFQQQCGSEVVNKTAGFKTVHRMSIHESRFDWD